MSNSKNSFFLWIVVAIVIAGSVFTVIKFNTSSPSGGDGPLADIDTSADWTKGQGESGVVLIEYGDFQCPACAQWLPIVDDIVNEFGKHITYSFRHFPLRNIHANAQISSQAAEAAGIQEKFFEMHDLLYENQEEWSNLPDPTETFIGYADEIGLNVAQFEEDIASNAVRDAVNDDYDSGNSSGVSGTPTFFLEGERIQAGSYEEFRNLIRTAVQAKS